MDIPFNDLTRQYISIRKEIDDAIHDVLRGGRFILGEKVREFENAFARYLGVKYTVGVASGTDAITLALLALGVGVGRGDEVILPANAYPSVFGVTAAGAKPVLADIDPKTFNIDSGSVEQSISDKTKAILAVHLYGNPADLDRLLTIGRKYGIPVIEDCAQAHGAEVRFQNPESRVQSSETLWRKVGSIGEVGCFSFYPTKNLGCYGDGGMVVTDNPDIYEKLKLLRMYGEKERYNSVLIGRNSRLDEVQAAILLVKLKYLDEWNGKRRKIAENYHRIKNQESRIKNGKGTKPTDIVILPVKHTSISSVNHLFVIRSKHRDHLKMYLEGKGIGTAIHYPVPIHLQPSFRYLGYKKGDFPESEKACKEVLSLPIYPELRDVEVEQIISGVNQFTQDNK